MAQMIRVTAPVLSPSDQTIALASTGGVAVRLTSGQTRVLQPMFATAAVAAGCSVVNIDEAGEEVEPAVPVVDDETRLAELQAAVRKMVELGDPADFTSTGRPKVDAVRRVVDVEFSAAELTAAFAEASLGDASS